MRGLAVAIVGANCDYTPNSMLDVARRHRGKLHACGLCGAHCWQLHGKGAAMGAVVGER